jgi:predicted nucleic acid-binding protein
MGLMLDTNVFIHSERSKSQIDFSPWEEYGDVYISAVTVSELLVGVHYADNESRRARRSAKHRSRSPPNNEIERVLFEQ